MLTGRGAEPSCERVVVPADLREDWASRLRAAGFDPGVPPPSPAPSRPSGTAARPPTIRPPAGSSAPCCDNRGSATRPRKRRQSSTVR
ncbi:class I SAM-dependent methyltransferase [Amycolatopsis sp. NBC_00438]